MEQGLLGLHPGVRELRQKSFCNSFDPFLICAICWISILGEKSNNKNHIENDAEVVSYITLNASTLRSVTITPKSHFHPLSHTHVLWSFQSECVSGNKITGYFVQQSA